MLIFLLMEKIDDQIVTGVCHVEENESDALDGHGDKAIPPPPLLFTE